MKKFAIAVSFESDTKPVETVCVEIAAADYEEAIRRGLRRAVAGRSGKWAPRSVVVVVEASAAKSLNISGGLRPPTLEETAALEAS